MSDRVDVIVVGGGLGGGLAAWQLSQYGRSVVLLEEGGGVDEPEAERGFRRRLSKAIGRRLGLKTESAKRDRFTYYQQMHRKGGKLRPVPIELGRGLGGSSALYSAALGRMRRSDFERSNPAPAGDPAALPNDWPIPFDVFRSYYRRVENLLRIRGESDPGDPDDDSQPRPSPPLGCASQETFDTLAKNGCSPYRLRVGIDYVSGCKECFGSRCQWGCKADGYNRAIQLAEDSGALEVVTRARVLEIYETECGAAVIYEGADGVRHERAAQRVIVAAGALNSPLILARSERLWKDRVRPAMLGRGLMFHVSDLFMVLGPRRSSPRAGPRKWLALRDFYADGAVNAGEIQSTGYTCTAGLAVAELRGRYPGLGRGPGLLLLDAARPFIWLGLKLLGEHPIKATIGEDLPHAHNHVREEDGRIVVSYVPSESLRQHCQTIRRHLRRAFSPFLLIFVTEPGLPNWGHPMGTCRMGLDPATSVTSPEGRVHGCDSIFVADASVFPSSGGTGPALTVGAHAIRVADIIAADLSKQNAEKLAVVALWPKTAQSSERVQRSNPGAVETGDS